MTGKSAKPDPTDARNPADLERAIEDIERQDPSLVARFVRLPDGTYAQVVRRPVDATRAAVATNVARKASRRQHALNLREQNLSIAQIAIKLDVHPRTVERYLAEQKTPAARRAVGQDGEIPG